MLESFSLVPVPLWLLKPPPHHFQSFAGGFPKETGRGLIKQPALRTQPSQPSDTRQ